MNELCQARRRCERGGRRPFHRSRSQTTPDKCQDRRDCRRRRCQRKTPHPTRRLETNGIHISPLLRPHHIVTATPPSHPRLAVALSVFVNLSVARRSRKRRRRCRTRSPTSTRRRRARRPSPRTRTTATSSSCRSRAPRRGASTARRPCRCRIRTSRLERELVVFWRGVLSRSRTRAVGERDSAGWGGWRGVLRSGSPRSRDDRQRASLAALPERPAVHGSRWFSHAIGERDAKACAERPMPASDDDMLCSVSSLSPNAPL